MNTPRFDESSTYFLGLVCMFQSNLGLTLEQARERAREACGIETPPPNPHTDHYGFIALGRCRDTVTPRCPICLPVV